jgi:hypothetical protein
VSAATAAAPRPPPRRLLPTGRMFLGPSFDYLAIGGGLSLVLVAALALGGQLGAASPAALWIPYLVLASNSAHFGASTVRLYTKPGAFRFWPFLTMGLPLATIAVLSAGLLWPERIGWHLHALYLTWSPFHYAAQAFGLACMYHYRSGGKLSAADRRLLRGACMLPFLFAFLDSPNAGLRWFVPERLFASYPVLDHWVVVAGQSLAILVFAAPVALTWRLYVGTGRGLPLISWLVVVTNGIWWIVFRFYDAFVWATVFHGIQYLAIVMIFHVKDQTAQPGNRRGPVAHALGFYAASLLLGYLLFYVWPFAYQLVGFGLSESMLLCAAAINIHHFIVDAYIWRLRRDRNYEVVMSSR